METRPKPREPLKVRRRARLVQRLTRTVGELLADGGSYSELSVEQLIKAVDVSRSTFYVYFRDKGDLLAAMGEEVTDRLALAGAHWFELGPDSAKKDLHDALRPLFETYRRYQVVLRAITEVASYDAGIRRLHLAIVERATEGVRRHIETHQAAGTAAPELDPRTTAAWLVWMLERGLHQLVAPATEAEAERLLDSMTELIWRALYEGHRS